MHYGLSLPIPFSMGNTDEVYILYTPDHNHGRFKSTFFDEAHASGLHKNQSPFSLDFFFGAKTGELAGDKNQSLQFFRRSRT